MRLIKTILETAFDEGNEIHVRLRTDRLDGCGFPEGVIESYPETIPVVICFHHEHVRRGMSPDIGDKEMMCTMSFEALNRVRIPYAAVVYISVPFEMEEETTEPVDAPNNNTHLRLVT